jgi:hypothetical protein
MGTRKLSGLMMQLDSSKQTEESTQMNSNHSTLMSGATENVWLAWLPHAFLTGRKIENVLGEWRSIRPTHEAGLLCLAI